MKVKDCMTKEVVTVKRSTTLSQLIDTFRKYNFHTLPVIEANRRLVGVVNFEDIMKVFQPFAAELTTMLQAVPFLELEPKQEDFLSADITSEMGILVVVDDILNTRFVSVGPEVQINKARAVMKLHNCTHLAVVEKGVLVGMISLFDIILTVFREKGVIK
ncbi:HPP family protein [Candidatus Omnitrophota bacterium]